MGKARRGATQAADTPISVRSSVPLTERFERRIPQRSSPARSGTRRPNRTRDGALRGRERPRGGVDLVCRIKLVVSGAPSVVVEKLAGTPRLAFSAASQALLTRSSAASASEGSARQSDTSGGMAVRSASPRPCHSWRRARSSVVGWAAAPRRTRARRTGRRSSIARSYVDATSGRQRLRSACGWTDDGAPQHEGSHHACDRDDRGLADAPFAQVDAPVGKPRQPSATLERASAERMRTPGRGTRGAGAGAAPAETSLAHGSSGRPARRRAHARWRRRSRVLARTANHPHPTRRRCRLRPGSASNDRP